MKTRLLTSLATAALFAGPALAADLPPMPVKGFPPVCNWCGAYLGVNAGGIWGRTDVTLTTFAPNFPAAIFAADGSPSFKRSSFIGGGQFGLNSQWRNVVFGLEGDIDGMNLSVSRVAGPFVGTVPPGGAAPTSFSFSDSVGSHWLATVRPRVGFASDNWLIYATGGLAFGEQNFAQSYTVTTTFAQVPAPLVVTSTGAGSTNRFAAGWSAGGGVEWRFGATSPWSAKVEYLHVDLGTVGFNTFLSSLPGFVARDESRLKADMVRVGINYRFWTH